MTFADAADYTFTALDLGSARAINNAGQVVGISGTSGNAKIWSGTTKTNLPSLEGSQTYANDINSTGSVVGSSIGSEQAWLYDGSTFRILSDPSFINGWLNSGNR